MSLIMISILAMTCTISQEAEHLKSRHTAQLLKKSHCPFLSDWTTEHGTNQSKLTLSKLKILCGSVLTMPCKDTKLPKPCLKREIKTHHKGQIWMLGKPPATQ